VFDEMSARKSFLKMERSLLGMVRDGSYNVRGVLLG
jgi:hypothetical protein